MGEEGVGGWAARAAFGGEEFDEDGGAGGGWFGAGGSLGDDAGVLFQDGLFSGVDRHNAMIREQGENAKENQGQLEDEETGTGSVEDRHWAGFRLQIRRLRIGSDENL